MTEPMSSGSPMRPKAVAEFNWPSCSFRSFVFEERGDVDIKGKGVMHTWYLVGRRDQ